MAKQNKPARKAAPSRTGRGQAGKNIKSRSKGAKAPPKASVKRTIVKKTAAPKSQSTKQGARPARKMAVPSKNKKGKALKVVLLDRKNIKGGQVKPIKTAGTKTQPRTGVKPVRPSLKVVTKKSAEKGTPPVKDPVATTKKALTVAKPPPPTKAKATENVAKTPASASKKKVPSPPSGQPIQAVMMGLEQGTAPAKALKRALKERFVVEFPVRSTPHVLYELISTPSGFSEWFCDDVDARGDEHVFFWGGEQQRALCIGRKAGELIRFRWMEDEDPGAFFELRIRVDDMTNDVALVVTDHAWPDEVEGARQLWTSQVAQLVRVIGA